MNYDLNNKSLDSIFKFQLFFLSNDDGDDIEWKDADLLSGLSNCSNFVQNLVQKLNHLCFSINILSNSHSINQTI